MTAHATKRRKTRHTPSSSDVEDDNASFASFGAEDSQNVADSDDDMQMAGAAQSEDDGDYDVEEEDEAGDTIEETATRKASSSKAVNGTNTTTISSRSPRTKNDRTAQLGASAYANGTFKSNVFKLQVDELLGQIRPRHGKRETAAETALHELKKSIEQIPTREPLNLLDAERGLIKEKIAIPFPDPRPPRDAKYKFAYSRPANINVVGSFPLKTGTRSRNTLEIDMTLTMPGSLFEEKDYLNHRYFYKRAYYLACVAAGLKKAHKTEYSFQFKLFHGDHLKPFLVVEHKPKKSGTDAVPAKWRINLIPCVADDQFPAPKLRPDKNCIRTQTAANQGDENGLTATSFYNSSLRSDMLMAPYLKLLHGPSKNCDAFLDACLLGSTWLRQRAFGSSLIAGGFGNFEWSALMALCLQGGGPGDKPLLSAGYSSYQLFKATLQLLAMKDFTKQGLAIGNTTAALPRTSNNTPTVWDDTRDHNLLYRVQLWSYRLLRYEARSTLSALGDQLYDGFDSTFILRVHEPLYRFDQIITIPMASFGQKPVSVDVSHRTNKLFDVLKQGLGDRVSQINIMAPTPEAWELGSSQPAHEIKGEMKIGLIVNPDTIRRTVDHGPSAESKTETAAFREFWGDKAELRRFKDGSILESLVWVSPQESGQSVLQQIINHLLKRHFGLAASDSLTYSGDDFPKLVRGGSDRIVFEPLMTRYKHFENDIRNLHDLPLSIRQIMPSSSQLCYTSMRPPTSGKAGQRSIPADVTIQFEGSSRWPDDLAAIQRTKIAFLLKINNLLQEAVDTIETRIGLENGDQDVLNQAYLDVIYDLDATFRLRIYHDREETLHQRRLKDKSTDLRSREVSAIGLSKYKRDYVKSPAQTQAITRLCTRFSALSGSIRLMKQWFASHLLANHVADEVIELLVVRTFTQSWPWQTPSSVQTGFLRTLLWISRWDWRVEPLIVDLSASGELKQPDAQAIRTNFEAWRKLDPALNRVALFAASNLDHDGDTWTEGRPAKVAAGRMTALAKAACTEVFEKQLQLEPSSLFSSPLGDFDFVLHIDQYFANGKATKRGKSNAAFKNLELDIINDFALIGFHPVEDLLQELETIYGSAILFFHGGTQRPIIAGLWSPLTAQRSWKVNLAYSTFPTAAKTGEEDALANLHKTAILAEIARLGGDLIEKVEVIT